MPTYSASPTRYDDMSYRRTGKSGLDLPAMSLGLWHNFGDSHAFDTQRAILRRAFDLGVTHFDLANNYGPPYGSAEENFGRHFTDDFIPYRDELIISSKAGYDMWPGPYGQGGSRKYMLSSLDQSLKRMNLDYVDIFYSHCPDPSVPIEETMGALHTAVTSGRALYVGISNYSPTQTAAAHRAAADLGIPLVIQQSAYSMFNRLVEQPDSSGKSLMETVEDLGMGMIAFSPLAQGLLTSKYLSGDVPAGSRASMGKFLKPGNINPVSLERVRGLNEIAAQRGQTLAQLALAWILRDDRVTSVLIGASSPEQLEDNIVALSGPALTAQELELIEEFAVHKTS